jgi:hypothetical protein
MNGRTDKNNLWFFSPQSRPPIRPDVSQGFVKRKIMRATKTQTNMDEPKRRETQTNNSY